MRYRWSADERGRPKDRDILLTAGRTSNADAPHQGERPRAYCHKHRDITAQPEGQTLAENQYRKKKSKGHCHVQRPQRGHDDGVCVQPQYQDDPWRSERNSPLVVAFCKAKERALYPCLRLSISGCLLQQRRTGRRKALFPLSRRILFAKSDQAEDGGYLAGGF